MDADQQKLVTDNIALANFLARMMWERSRETLDREELRSLAYHGLVSAAVRWRPYGEENGYSEESIASGKHFSVFARKRILGQIMDAMRDADHVQRSVRSSYKAMQKAGLGQGASEEEISVKTGLSIGKMREVMRAIENSPISLDIPNGEPSSGSSTALNRHEVQQHVESEHDVESSVMVTSITGAFVAAFMDLTDLQQCVITMRYYLGMELQVIAAELSLGLTPVRETHTEAVLLVHSAMLAEAEEQRAA